MINTRIKQYFLLIMKHIHLWGNFVIKCVCRISKQKRKNITVKKEVSSFSLSFTSFIVYAQCHDVMHNVTACNKILQHVIHITKCHNV